MIDALRAISKFPGSAGSDRPDEIDSACRLNNDPQEFLLLNHQHDPGFAQWCESGSPKRVSHLRQKTGLESPPEAPPVVGYEVGAWFAEHLEVRSNSQKTLLLGSGERNLGPRRALCRQAPLCSSGELT